MFSGEPVVLEEMMQAREKRFIAQKRLSDISHLPIICFTLNVPGEIKHTPELQKVFEIGLEQIEKLLLFINAKIKNSEQIIEKTGCEAYMSVDGEPFELKRQMDFIEDNHPLGRLFDIDVIKTNGIKISRQDIGAEYRECFLCGKQAHECARSRNHSVSEMQENIVRMINSYFENQYNDFIVKCAVRALLCEVNTTPKPGLVDRSNNGAHSDMDTFSFIDSTASLIPYLYLCTQKGAEYQGRSPEELFRCIRYLGQNAECEMFKATDGVNTHKGAIFSFGILCAALGYSRQFGEDIDFEAVFCTIKEMTKNLVHQDFDNGSATFGQKAYTQYGITGIRGEVMNGFPSVRQFGMPVLKSYLSAGYSLNDAGVMTLLNLIAHVEDTNMIKRAGLEQAQEVRHKIQAWLQTQSLLKIDFSEIIDLDNEFIRDHLSPGGCADLLAVTCFLHFVEMGRADND